MQAPSASAKATAALTNRKRSVAIGLQPTPRPLFLPSSHLSSHLYDTINPKLGALSPLKVLEVDILWPRWVARIGVTRATEACFLAADRQCTKSSRSGLHAAPSAAPTAACASRGSHPSSKARQCGRRCRHEVDAGRALRCDRDGRACSAETGKSLTRLEDRRHGEVPITPVLTLSLPPRWQELSGNDQVRAAQRQQQRSHELARSGQTTPSSWGHHAERRCERAHRSSS